MNNRRKVIVELKVKLLLNVDEESQISDIVDELDYNFSDTTGSADVIDTEISDFEIIDSK